MWRLPQLGQFRSDFDFYDYTNNNFSRNHTTLQNGMENNGHMKEELPVAAVCIRYSLVFLFLRFLLHFEFKTNFQDKLEIGGTKLKIMYTCDR